MAILIVTPKKLQQNGSTKYVLSICEKLVLTYGLVASTSPFCFEAYAGIKRENLMHQKKIWTPHRIS